MSAYLEELLCQKIALMILTNDIKGDEPWLDMAISKCDYYEAVRNGTLEDTP